MDNSTQENLSISPSRRTSFWPTSLVAIIFLLLGFFFGFVFAKYPPQGFVSPQKTCTPRPACLDATPRCLIPETPDMCPPSVTPTPSVSSNNNQTFKDELGRYQINLPKNWQLIEHSSSFPNINQFQTVDHSTFVISILDSESDSLSDFLQKQDKTDLTSWEGQKGRVVISSEKTTVAGLPAIKRVEEWLAAGFTTVNTYTLVNRQVYSFYIVSPSESYQTTDAFIEYQKIIDSFEPLYPSSGFVCPQTEWVDCMPSPNSIAKPECQSDYLQWAETNCPGFKGAAL